MGVRPRSAPRLGGHGLRQCAGMSPEHREDSLSAFAVGYAVRASANGLDGDGQSESPRVRVATGDFCITLV
jgi:hypothetical protein